MRYEANYIGYELGNFLPPEYQGHEKCDVFFLLLQNPIPNRNAETFCVKLGKSRFLDGNFYADCLKVLIYFEIGGGQFSVQDIALNKKRDGTKYFDAIAFLNQMGVEYQISDTAHYRYFKSRLHESKRELILEENESKFHIIMRRINADDFELLNTHYNHHSHKANLVKRNGDAIARALFEKLFFILIYADEPPYAEYRELYCVESEDALWEYLSYNYEVEKSRTTLKKLKTGYIYENEMRQGVGKYDVLIKVFHEDNIFDLMDYLYEAQDDKVSKCILFEHLKSAENIEEIQEVLSVYNDSFENYWA